MTWWPTDPEVKAGKELGAAIFAAGVAAYVRAKGEPSPLTWRSFAARMAESVVSGFLAIGAAGVMEWTDPRTTVGLAAAFGLIGTGFITDFLTRWLARRADRT